MDLSKYEKKHVLEKAGMEHACTEKNGLKIHSFWIFIEKDKEMV